MYNARSLCSTCHLVLSCVPFDRVHWTTMSVCIEFRWKCIALLFSQRCRYEMYLHLFSPNNEPLRKAINTHYFCFHLSRLFFTVSALPLWRPTNSHHYINDCWSCWRNARNLILANRKWNVRLRIYKYIIRVFQWFTYFMHCRHNLWFMFCQK